MQVTKQDGETFIWLDNDNGYNGDAEDCQGASRFKGKEIELQPVKDKTESTIGAQFSSKEGDENSPQELTSKDVSTELVNEDGQSSFLSNKEASLNSPTVEMRDPREWSECEEFFWQLIDCCDCTIL